MSSTTTQFRRAHQVLPDELVDVQHSWRLADMASRCPVEGVTAGQRFDPFFDGLWEDGSSAVWTNREVSSRLEQVGFTKVPKLMRMPADRARVSLLSGRLWTEKLRFLAALDSWRTLTCEQAAAMAGTNNLLDAASTIPRSMWNLDLIDLGQFRGMTGRGFSRRGWLYRPARTQAFDNEVVPNLTLPEWVGVTAGLPWDPGGQFDRHNVLATELGLRAAEFADVGAVLGEKLSKAELLCAHLPPGLLPRGETKAADLTIVRRDGLRIAVEVTANQSATFSRKVQRWAQLLDSAPLADSGLVVVFVVARPAGSTEGRSLRNLVAKRIAHETKAWPGQVGDRVADRMFVASWQEWFPARHRLAPGFLSLRALSPSGPAGDLWQVKQLLGETALPFRPRNPAAVRAVLHNSQALAGVPWWIRQPEVAPSVADLLLSRVDRDAIPAGPASGGLALYENPGPIGETGLPPRLRWL